MDFTTANLLATAYDSSASAGIIHTPASMQLAVDMSDSGGVNGQVSASSVSAGGTVVGRMDWTDAEAEQLMTAYQTHRCLWDPSHPNYHCNSHRTEAYYSILETLGPKFTITDIKKKINSIRTQFNQERNRILKLARSGIQREESRYKYYDRLSFLTESVDSRRNQRFTLPKIKDEYYSSEQQPSRNYTGITSPVTAQNLSIDESSADNQVVSDDESTGSGGCPSSKDDNSVVEAGESNTYYSGDNLETYLNIPNRAIENDYANRASYQIKDRQKSSPELNNFRFPTHPIMSSSDPTKINSKPTCAIIPEASNRNTSIAYKRSEQHSPIVRKKQRLHINPETCTSPMTSLDSRENNGVTNVGTSSSGVRTSADDSFGSYIAAELATISNHAIKNKLKLQIVSLIMQSSNQDMDS